LISLVTAEAIMDQKNIFKAAKKVGVKRIVPCDFGTACPPGVRALHDNVRAYTVWFACVRFNPCGVVQKLAIRSFLRELDVPYTSIDVGWWMQLTLPHPLGSPAGWITDISHEFFGPGNVKNAVTSLMDIGRFVARIIEDPRTINKYVFCWSEEVTLDKVYEIADRISGQKLSDAKVLVRF
jgi:hypothetical protein